MVMDRHYMCSTNQLIGRIRFGVPGPDSLVGPELCQSAKDSCLCSDCHSSRGFTTSKNGVLAPGPKKSSSSCRVGSSYQCFSHGGYSSSYHCHRTCRIISAMHRDGREGGEWGGGATKACFHIPSGSFGLCFRLCFCPGIRTGLREVALAIFVVLQSL